MVTKQRYLCHAPRPEDWDVKAAALLKSVGGNPSQLDALVRRSLQQLRQVQYVLCIFVFELNCVSVGWGFAVK